mgnify:FL=1
MKILSFKSNKVKLMKIKENAIIPARATKGSAGLDLYACIEEPINLNAGESVLIPTGIAVELPNNEMAAFIFARSGLATKYGISLSNGVGVVDSDYRGEICVGLRNFGKENYAIEKNERIAQMVIMPVISAIFSECEALNKTDRGNGGFGSTGK